MRYRVCTYFSHVRGMEDRECKECQRHLPFSEFYRTRRTVCKACIARLARTDPAPRECPVCKEHKKRSEFYHAKQKCKSCFDKRRKADRDDETRLLPVLQSIMRHTATRVHLINRRTGTHERCDVDVNYLLHLWDTQKGLCALSGVPMTHTSRPVDDRRYNVSLDRIDSSKNYLRSNVQLVTQTANIMKHSMLQQDFIEVCTAVAHKSRCEEQKNKALQQTGASADSTTLPSPRGIGCREGI